MEPENKFGALRLNFALFLETLKLYLHEVWIRSQQEMVKEKESVAITAVTVLHFPWGPVHKKKRMTIG